jgi:DNA polymerase-3 subunit gamma/tau
LDQAIACCGSKLDPTEVRGLLGMFSLDSLDQVTQALAQSDSRRMLDVVMELERNGRSLQHFCRELARYFRNLLVARVVGAQTRLIAASPNEQQRLAEIAARFSEEDLTRYLQITLDVFKDLQTSLQPRLHLEIGLLRLVHAGRMGSVEEALANMGSGPAPEPVKAKPASVPAPIRPAPPKLVAPPSESTAAAGPWRERLHAKLLELGMTFTADAIEHSQITEANGELQFLTPDDFRLAMSEKDIGNAVQQLAGKPLRLKIRFGTPGEQAAPQPIAKPKDDVSERALAHPEVRRFQEMFPDAQVRTVRNLKE